ncbi:MAG: DNA-binding protein [Firmicutes bacterium]|nr:DNA-binding protein [Bacillota bacterium]
MPLFLGLDSSNYTSSAALVSEDGAVVCDSRRLLRVREGEKGLRQSEALFQHWQNLPELLAPILDEHREEIAGVCASSRPRPAEGSYMPVFGAGTALGRVIASSLGVPYIETSHQQGHIAAAALGSCVDISRPLICAHLSGGTLELVVADGEDIRIAAATKDISYGQLLDRAGVELGFPFPAGRYIDEAAMSYAPEGRQNPFSRVFVDETGLNLSGLETQLKTKMRGFELPELAYYLMERISESFVALTDRVIKGTGTDSVLITGGVASSAFLRSYVSKQGRDWVFGQPRLCSDNAVGCALICRDRLLNAQ